MSVFAARYARAFADVVADKGLDPAEVQKQAGDFASTLAGSEDLRRYLLNPSIPGSRRIAALDAVNGKVGCGPQVRNFLAVLIRHERLGALEGILGMFRSEMDRRLNIAEVVVTTARPLDGQEAGDLEQRVARLAGSRVRASFREDPALIGGAVVRVGSTIYDGSVRGRLDRLKDQLTGA